MLGSPAGADKFNLVGSKALSAERKASNAINRRFTQMDTERNPFRNITAEAQRAQNNLCDPCVLGTTSDPNFVTFVLFVVINCLTTKDAKYTKEEIQGRDDSREDAKHAKFGEIGNYFSLRLGAIHIVEVVLLKI